MGLWEGFSYPSKDPVALDLDPPTPNFLLVSKMMILPLFCALGPAYDAMFLPQLYVSFLSYCSIGVSLTLYMIGMTPDRCPCQHAPLL